jgi:2-haloacid dehalogenase
VEAGPYQRYRDVLGSVLTAMLGHRGAEPSPEEVAAFGGSVVDWPAFPDSGAALARLHHRFRLGVITNCDDDLFAASEAKLGVTFDWVVTAQQTKRYKPNPRGFELMFERVGIPPTRILHVAQSLYHDHVPAKRLGLSTVWVDRRGDRPGSGATPPADATPDLTVPDMATLASLAAQA